MNDNERAQKSFDLAAETTKQLISLSTAIITVTIAFAKDFFGSRQSGLEWLLALAWLLYLISLISGIFTLELIPKGKIKLLIVESLSESENRKS